MESLKILPSVLPAKPVTEPEATPAADPRVDRETLIRALRPARRISRGL